MNLLQKLREGMARKQRLLIPAKKVGASRAIYQGESEMPLTHFYIDTPDGDMITLELTFTQLREAIEALTYTYYAINPPIKNRNYGGFDA